MSDSQSAPENKVARSTLTSREQKLFEHTKIFYQLALLVSVGINIVLAVAKYVDEHQASALKAEASRLQNELMLANNTPSFSIFRLTYYLSTLSGMESSGKPLPILQNVTYYRIIENTVFEHVRRALRGSQFVPSSEGTVTFLITMNAGNAQAYGARLHSQDGGQVFLGEIASNTAALLPLIYQYGTPRQEVIEIDPVHLSYGARVGAISKNLSMPVPVPGQMSWIPVIGNIQGVGRSSAAEKEANRFDSLLPLPRQER